MSKIIKNKRSINGVTILVILSILFMFGLGILTSSYLNKDKVGEPIVFTDHPTTEGYQCTEQSTTCTEDGTPCLFETIDYVNNMMCYREVTCEDSGEWKISRKATCEVEKCRRNGSEKDIIVELVYDCVDDKLDFLQADSEEVKSLNRTAPTAQATKE